MLQRFEQILESAVEGGLRRLFPAQLQPVQIAKAAARAMEDARVVGLKGPEVPNQYVVRLAPADMERFGGYREMLSREVGRYLADYAADRGLVPVAEPRVSLQEDHALPPGVVRVDGRFLDLEPERQRALEHELEGTRQLRVVRDAPRERALIRLVDPDGVAHELDPEVGTVRLGRSLDNDVVISDARVSRYHAQIVWERDRWWVRDLGSTNGTFVDGQKLGGEPEAITSGSELRLGMQSFSIRWAHTRPDGSA